MLDKVKVFGKVLGSQRNLLKDVRIFFNETIECDILREEPARLKKNNIILIMTKYVIH